MGHLFCRSHWEASVDGKNWTGKFGEYACFGTLEWRKNKAVRTKLVPTYEYPVYGERDPDELIPRCGDLQCVACPKVTRRSLYESKFGGSVTKEQMEQYIQDVMTAFPGVGTRLDEFVFEYKIGNPVDYYKFLGMASFIRCVEEWWLWINEYFEIRSRGIPIDVALLCMGLGSRDPRTFCGHAFIGTFKNLVSLKDFNMVDAYLKGCERETAGGIWYILDRAKPWFDPTLGGRMPHQFVLTRKKYDALCDDKLSYVDKFRIVKDTEPFQKDYDAIAA